jgi:hypothetical protein
VNKEQLARLSKTWLTRAPRQRPVPTKAPSYKRPNEATLDAIRRALY